MKFWKRLRWAATAAFIALLLLLAWLGADSSSPSTEREADRHTAPTFYR